MSAVGSLVLAILVICAALAAAGWVIVAMTSFAKDAASAIEAAVGGVLDILGRRRLLPVLDAPVDLLDLEGKLADRDHELDLLRTYEPERYWPEQLKPATYKEELPKMFRQAQQYPNVVAVNIDEVRRLVVMGPIPAHEVLGAILVEPPPAFNFADPLAPKPVSVPPSWSEWDCKEESYDVSQPLYRGLLAPLNYFVRRAFKDAYRRANALQQRQEVAREKARERNEKLKRLHQEAKEKFERVKQEQTVAWAEVERKSQQRREAFFEDYKREMSTIRELVEAAQSKSLAGVTARIEQTLKVESFPHFVPTEFALKFDEDSRILILEHEFPNVGAISWIKCVTLKSGQTTKAANQREAKDAALLLYPALTLRLACEVARLDLFNQIEAIVVNGWANYTEKSTGQMKRAYCSSLFSKKSELLGINLAAVDPTSAFAALKGVGARSLDLVPIAPVLKLNKEDSRFVDAKDVLENLAAGENLAAMDWEDFEHLCRQLFERAFAGSGAEVKVTQASRDQGVDAVIFDPDVLRGGKIVVQAKRYTNTVDVSAVRDLYGAIINEGATKGILVTTSHFGPDAYGFAKDKPITLLNGQELLGLLQKYGYTFRIDLAEARQLSATWPR